MNSNLFTPPRVSIVPVSGDDARLRTESFQHLSELIRECEATYPGIHRWLSSKVVPGLVHSERAAFVGYQDDVPVISAVVKRGPKAKLCHLRLHEGVQKLNVGEALFSVMVLTTRHEAEEIHFSLPESLWETERLFFGSFGFIEAQRAKRQYRSGETELFCTAPFSTVLHCVRTKLPRLAATFSAGGYSGLGQLLLSVKPRHGYAILSGRKRIEIRRRFDGKWQGARAVLYASRPASLFVGEATIGHVLSESPEAIWHRFAGGIGCERAEFDQYALGAQRLSAIELVDVETYRNPTPLAQLDLFFEHRLHPPQSFLVIHPNDIWGQAVTLMGLLRGGVSISAPTRLLLTDEERAVRRPYAAARQLIERGPTPPTFATYP